MLKNDSTSKFNLIFFQKKKFYIIKNIGSYIYPKIKTKGGTLKTPVNSTQRAKYF